MGHLRNCCGWMHVFMRQCSFNPCSSMIKHFYKKSNFSSLTRADHNFFLVIEGRKQESKKMVSDPSEIALFNGRIMDYYLWNPDEWFGHWKMLMPCSTLLQFGDDYFPHPRVPFCDKLYRCKPVEIVILSNRYNWLIDHSTIGSVTMVYQVSTNHRTPSELVISYFIDLVFSLPLVQESHCARSIAFNAQQKAGRRLRCETVGVLILWAQPNRPF